MERRRSHVMQDAPPEPEPYTGSEEFIDRPATGSAKESVRRGYVPVPARIKNLKKDSRSAKGVECIEHSWLMLDNERVPRGFKPYDPEKQPNARDKRYATGFDYHIVLYCPNCEGQIKRIVPVINE